MVSAVFSAWTSKSYFWRDIDLHIEFAPFTTRYTIAKNKQHCLCTW